MLKSKEAEQEYQRYKAGIAASERLYKEELAKNGDRSGNEKRIVTDARSFAERRSSLAAYRRIKKRITMLYDRLETEKQFGEAHNPRTSFYDYYCKEYLSIGKEYNRVFHADDAAINEAVASLLRSVDSMLVAAQKRTEAGYEENKLDYAKRLKEINSALVNLDSQISKENRGENLPVAEATEVIDESTGATYSWPSPADERKQECG